MSQHQQKDAPITSFPEAKSSGEISSDAGTRPATDNEKTTDAEAGLQLQKPPAGPPGGPPPNGGLTAWLQVLGGFFLFFNTWVCRRCFLSSVVTTGADSLTGYLEHFRCVSDLL